jgi:hypothetical protein
MDHIGSNFNCTIIFLVLGADLKLTSQTWMQTYRVSDSNRKRGELNRKKNIDRYSHV